MGKDKLAKGKDWSLATLLRKPDLTAAEMERARREQIGSVATLAPLFLMAQLLTGVVVLLSFWDTKARDLLSMWSAALLFGSIGLTVGYRFLQNWPELKPFTDEHLEAAATAVLALAILWGALPVMLTAHTDPVAQRTLGVILSGTIFVGGFMLSRTPRIASSFVWPIAIGIVVSLQLQQDARNDLLSVVAIVHAAMVVFCIHLNHRVFLEELRSRTALGEQAEVISILLRDFGESTSDWLWQTDVDGLIQQGPGQSGMFDDPHSTKLRGKTLTSLFERNEGLTVLQRSIQRHQGFRDLALVLKADMADSRDGRQVWWQITGKPVYERGIFTGFRGVASDISRTKEHESRIAYMAHYDGLTGLPNRMTLHREMTLELERTDAGSVRALVLFDLDNFKWVNDTLGHPAGDALLKMVAERVAAVCVERDDFARLGGDEFALIVRRPDEKALHEWLDRLVAVLATPYELWGSTVMCSASIGMRRLDAPGMDADTLLKHVDLALYQAKAKGRKRWEQFTDEMEARARQRREIEDDLQVALSSDQIIVHFQPQIDAQTSELVSLEALLRWEHPRRGLIMPGAFITHAEDMGLIGQLGEWAVRQTLRDAMRLPDHVRVAVNMSPLQIHSSTLVSNIVNALARTGISAERLELEITESVLMTDTDFTLERLHQIKDLGVRIALDDFGTGYSSLSYLRSFPFDKIKIDQSFVRGLETSADSRSITKATIELARSLNMRVTAEGVETEYQRKFLVEHGVDTLQGWLISKAVPIEALSGFCTIAPRPDGQGGQVVKLDKVRADRRSTTRSKGRSAAKKTAGES